MRNGQIGWVSSAGEQTNMFLLLARIAGLDAQLCDSIFQGGSRFKVLLLAVVGKDCHLQRRRRDWFFRWHCGKRHGRGKTCQERQQNYEASVHGMLVLSSRNCGMEAVSFEASKICSTALQYLLCCQRKRNEDAIDQWKKHVEKHVRLRTPSFPRFSPAPDENNFWKSAVESQVECWMLSHSANQKQRPTFQHHESIVPSSSFFQLAKSATTSTSRFLKHESQFVPNQKSHFCSERRENPRLASVCV